MAINFSRFDKAASATPRRSVAERLDDSKTVWLMGRPVRSDAKGTLSLALEDGSRVTVRREDVISLSAVGDTDLFALALSERAETVIETVSRATFLSEAEALTLGQGEGNVVRTIRDPRERCRLVWIPLPCSPDLQEQGYHTCWTRFEICELDNRLPNYDRVAYR